MMKLILVLMSFIVCLYSQEILEQSWDNGAYRPIKKELRDVPRFYICGAAVWKKREMVPQPDHCYTYCRRVTTNWGKRKCKWLRKCDHVAPALDWVRANGIVFQYCHFQQWTQKIFLEETGNWDWQGMQACPQNQYVQGLRTKTTPRDGLAGLILLCRNMRNSAQKSQKLVFDGEGPWRDTLISGNFAVGFKAKFQRDYVAGIALQMVPTPTIFAYNFQYQFPVDFNPSPIQIEMFVIENRGSVQMSKEIQFTKSKTFERIWQNEKGYMHGYSQTNSESKTISVSATVGVPSVASATTGFSTTYSMSQTNYQYSSDKFQFGVKQTFQVGQRHKDIVPVPACERVTIKQVVYTYDRDIPYRVDIGYTNGSGTEYETIHGVYRGIATSEAKTYITSEKNIC